MEAFELNTEREDTHIYPNNLPQNLSVCVCHIFALSRIPDRGCRRRSPTSGSIAPFHRPWCATSGTSTRCKLNRKILMKLNEFHTLEWAVPVRCATGGWCHTPTPPTASIAGAREPLHSHSCLLTLTLSNSVPTHIFRYNGRTATSETRQRRFPTSDVVAERQTGAKTSHSKGDPLRAPQLGKMMSDGNSARIVIKILHLHLCSL